MLTNEKFHFNQDENFPYKYFVNHSSEETFVKYLDNFQISTKAASIKIFLIFKN